MKIDFEMRATIMVCASAFSASAMLLACGGEGGSVATDNKAPETISSISGTVASGAPYPAGLPVTVYKNGAKVGEGVIGQSGEYAIVLTTAVASPLVVKTTGPDVDTLYSICPAGMPAGCARINVTPITNLITARLSSTGNPADVKDAEITKEKTESKITEVMNVLAPVTAAVGDTSNPLTATFTPNGKGHDRLLDSVKIKLTPATNAAGQATSNVDITVVTAQANGSAPIIIPTFSSNASTIPPLSSAGAAVTSIPQDTLVPDGTAAKVTDLVARIQACFAVPFVDRISTGGTGSADVKAEACKTLFSGNNPANYKNNGFSISKTGNFSGIFNSGATGAKFDLGKFEFLRANGDVVFSWRSVSPDGANVNYSRAVAKLEGSDLKIIGNQYNYDADVGPQIHARNFINDASYNYKSTGYRVYVENKQINGNPAFNRVEVTAPNAAKFTLRPTAGYSYLVFVNPVGSSATLTNSGSVMLNLLPTNAGGVDKSTIIAKTPTDYYWADTSFWTDAAISAIPQIAKWKFDYFNAGNTGSTPDTTEYRTTTERAPTLAELAPKLFATYTSDFVAQAQAATSASGGFSFTAPGPNDDQRMLIDFSANGDKDAWVVPSGVQAPTELGVWGRAPYLSNGATPPVNISNRFNDATTFSATSRKAIVQCNRQSNDDKHCEASVAVGASGKYAVGTFVSYFSLQTYGPSNVRSTSGLATYKPSLNP